MRGFLARLRHVSVGIPSLGLGIPSGVVDPPHVEACFAAHFDEATIITATSESATVITPTFGQATTITVSATACACGE